MTASDPRVGEIEVRNLIAFATECADPNWSLSIPPVAKDVITKLLAELRDRDEVIAKVAEVAETLASSTLDADNYMRGRGSGFRIAAANIRAAMATAKGES